MRAHKSLFFEEAVYQLVGLKSDVIIKYSLTFVIFLQVIKLVSISFSVLFLTDYSPNRDLFSANWKISL